MGNSLFSLVPFYTKLYLDRIYHKSWNKVSSFLFVSSLLPIASNTVDWVIPSAADFAYANSNTWPTGLAVHLYLRYGVYLSPLHAWNVPPVYNICSHAPKGSTKSFYFTIIVHPHNYTCFDRLRVKPNTINGHDLPAGLIQLLCQKWLWHTIAIFPLLFIIITLL